MASVETTKNNSGHTSVLVPELLEYLNPKPGGLYLDVTFGAGGHTRAILDHEPKCSVIALDWDAASIDAYLPELQAIYGKRIQLVWGNFAHLYAIVKKIGVTKVDGIIADFGTSQMQIFDRAGFSFNRDTKLDMRMSPAHQLVTAAQVINTSEEEKLKQIFLQLGEERNAALIARAILQRRQKKKFETTLDLAELVASVMPQRGPRRIHPATKVFQALRIYVNHELENIQAFLSAAVPLLVPGGRLVCISFHSLEDRLVKQFYRDQELAGFGTLITKKVVTPSDFEIATNPSSRSAKLRVLERTDREKSSF
jgi:16S rRNA (cytosine1402-N4)-methyltransferase